MAQGVPGRLRPRIFSTFGTTRVVGRQPNAPAAFTPGEIPGTHFQRRSRPQGTWFCRKEPRKSQVTPSGIDPGTVRLVAQRLNHYATPGPNNVIIHILNISYFYGYTQKDNFFFCARHKCVGRTVGTAPPIHNPATGRAEWSVPDRTAFYIVRNTANRT